MASDERTLPISDQEEEGSYIAFFEWMVRAKAALGDPSLYAAWQHGRRYEAARAAAPAGDELRRALANWAEWLRVPGLPPDRLADPVKVLLLASGLIASDEGGVLRWLDPTPAAPGPDELEAAVIKIVNDEWKAPEVKAEMVREAFARARRKEARDA
jgi:hypothetical protein